MGSQSTRVKNKQFCVAFRTAQIFLVNQTSLKEQCTTIYSMLVLFARKYITQSEKATVKKAQKHEAGST